MRKIIHVDMDCFYAAVEVRDNPRLKGQPVVVGGSPQGRGVIAAANYEARKFGVKSAMPSSQALRLCPCLNFVKPSFQKYKAESQKVRQIFAEYTLLVEPLSLDEAFLDVTDCGIQQGSATKIAEEIRKKIFEITGLTASAGIAPNKFLAKVASDWNKPNGQFTVAPEDIENFVRELPITKIFGVGKVTAEKMHRLNIFTCKDLQKLSNFEMHQRFGNWGRQLYNLCRGIDDRAVNPSRERKSLSVESTFASDISSGDEIAGVITELYQEFQSRSQKAKLRDADIRSFFIKFKFHTFQQTGKERAFDRKPSLEQFQALARSLRREKPEHPLRLIGLGVKLYTETERLERTAQLELL